MQRPGNLRHNITIQQRGITTDSFGQQVTTWSDLITVWASIEALTAREILAAQAVQSQVSHKITLRYRPELSSPMAVAAMRVVYSGRYFNISGAVNIDERNINIELLVSEGLNLG